MNGQANSTGSNVASSSVASSNVASSNVVRYKKGPSRKKGKKGQLGQLGQSRKKGNKGQLGQSGNNTKTNVNEANCSVCRKRFKPKLETHKRCNNCQSKRK